MMIGVLMIMFIANKYAEGIGTYVGVAMMILLGITYYWVFYIPALIISLYVIMKMYRGMA